MHAAWAAPSPRALPSRLRIRGQRGPCDPRWELPLERGSQVPGGGGWRWGLPPLGQLARAGPRGCGLLSPWKLWVRAWLHVPGRKQPELASEREAPPGLQEGSSASEGVTPGPTFPLKDLSSNCILPASPLDLSSRLSLEARAKLRPTTFPVPEKSWREPPSLWHGASSRLRWQRLGRVRARGPILLGLRSA